MKKRLEKIMEFWKKIWGQVAVFSIFGSIIALFIASFVCDKNITLEVMNEWVSLVAGMSALILSIISLFLSFYNVEQSNEIQRETLKLLNEVKDGIGTKINDLQNDMNREFREMENRDFKGSGKKIDPVKITGSGSWEEFSK